MASYPVSTQNRGSDWVDLGPDQCNMAYTSEGNEIFHYDVCTNTPLATVPITPSTGLGTCYAHRLITTGPDTGDTLVACSNQVVLVNASGAIIQTYLPGSSLLFALNLDPDGTSFWTAEYFGGDVYKVDIASGTTLLHFKVSDFGFSPNPLGGVAVFGEITGGGPGPGIGVPEFGAPTLLVMSAGFVVLAFWSRLRRTGSQGLPV